MRNTMKIEIPQLYKIKRGDFEKLVMTYMSAFEEYPKIMNAFPKQKQRLLALEATIRYYLAYDLRYGCGFSTDENVNDAVIVVHSDRMNYTFLRHLIAGSYNKGYRNAMNKLSKQERNMRVKLFEELDELEKTVEIPRPHIYVDFLGVSGEHQHQGRGRKLMSNVIKLADESKLPVMLFTNTDADVAFYQSLGFEIIGVTSSEKFGFTNTYLLYTPTTL